MNALVNRMDIPSNKQILEDISKCTNQTQRARTLCQKYGISQTTARKWIKNSEEYPDESIGGNDYTFSVKCNFCGEETTISQGDSIEINTTGFRATTIRCSKCGNNFHVSNYENEIEASLKGIQSMITFVMSYHKNCSDSVLRLDKETQDILHEIELTDFENGDSLARELQLIRRERRRNKDMAEMSLRASNYFESNRGKEIISEMQRMVIDVKNIEEKQKTRKYFPKVRDDLTICSEKEERMKGVTDEMQ